MSEVPMPQWTTGPGSTCDDYRKFWEEYKGEGQMDDKARYELQRAWKQVCEAIYDVRQHPDEPPELVVYEDGTVLPVYNALKDTDKPPVFATNVGFLEDHEAIKDMMNRMSHRQVFEHASNMDIKEFLEEMLGSRPGRSLHLGKLKKRRGRLVYRYSSWDAMHHLEIEWIDRYHIPFVGTIATTEYKDIESLIIAVGKEAVENAMLGKEVEVEVVGF